MLNLPSWLIMSVCGQKITKFFTSHLKFLEIISEVQHNLKKKQLMESSNINTICIQLNWCKREIYQGAFFTTAELATRQ